MNMGEATLTGIIALELEEDQRFDFDVEVSGEGPILFVEVEERKFVVTVMEMIGSLGGASFAAESAEGFFSQ
jgi:hypothetical protein